MAIRGVFAALALSTSALATAAEAEGTKSVEWPQYGGSQSFDRYSPLDQINAQNVKGLKVLWTRPAVDPSLMKQFPTLAAGEYFRSTPIMVGGVLYAPNGVGLIEAFDPKTGKTIWVQQPFAPTLAEASGASTRGVAYWPGNGQPRVFGFHGNYLYALDARTGRACEDFGEHGRVNLRRAPGADFRFFVSGGPLVVGDVVVVGGAGGGRRGSDYGDQMKSIPETVRAFDVKSGKLLWEFSPMPAPGDPARASWGAESADVAGSMGSYGTLSADEELGYVYVPLKTPTPPAWGGWRPGDNLYGTSLVALDARTGKKIWHFQLIHHDLWHYDVAAPPILGDITVNGRRIKAVMQTAKNALLFTLDRTNGKPVWPIEERPVPQSTVPGEHTSPTQPFPTRPAPMARQGFTLDDLIDFTPQLHAEALQIAKQYNYGPAYTPPSIHEDSTGGKRGSLTLPGTDGGCNWNCGAFDPETDTYYTVAVDIVANYAVQKPKTPGATMEWVMREDDNSVWSVPGPQGLPLNKPPYGEVEAINMDTGEYRWRVPNGDGPKDNPLLKDLHLPALGVAGRNAPLVTKSLLFVGEGSTAVDLGTIPNGNGVHFRAYDKRTGEVLMTMALPAGTTAGPMTYAVAGKQYVIITVGGNKGPTEWIALGL